MKRSEQFHELAAALAKAQGQITGASKDAANPHFKSDYATLDSVWAACRAPLSSNGLSVIQSPAVTETGSVILTTLITHASGQWFENELELVPRDRSPQSLGSAITYGRRYVLMALVGIAPAVEDEGHKGDDDGNAANGAPGDAHQPASPRAPKKPEAAIDPSLYVCKFGQKFKGIAIRDIPADELRGYCKYIRDKAALEKKPVGGLVLEFMTNADAYLTAQDPGSFQNAPASLPREPGSDG